MHSAAPCPGEELSGNMLSRLADRAEASGALGEWRVLLVVSFFPEALMHQGGRWRTLLCIFLSSHSTSSHLYNEQNKEIAKYVMFCF